MYMVDSQTTYPYATVPLIMVRTRVGQIYELGKYNDSELFLILYYLDVYGWFPDDLSLCHCAIDYGKD